MCDICAGTRCEWVELGPELLNNTAMMYSRIIADVGYLGRSNRTPVPKCVINKIREMYPEDDEEKYLGFYSESVLILSIL